MAITMTELARLAKVSQSTVSLVLNESEGRRISPATEERIKKLAQRHNFRANRAAVELRRRSASVIGISMVSTAHPENAQKTLFFQEFFRKRGFRVVFSFYSSLEDVGSALENIFDQGIDALIAWDHHPIIDREQIPTVFYGFQNPNYDCVNWDAKKYAQDVIEIARKNHHSRLVFAGVADSRRFNELRKEAEKFGMSLTSISGSSLEGCFAEASQILSQPEHSTLFLCNDFLAMGIYSAASRCSLRIPDDISVIGMDNIRASSYMVPPLSTFDLNLENLCTTLSDLLLMRIENKERPTEHILLPMELIIRSSTKTTNPKGIENEHDKKM